MRCLVPNAMESGLMLSHISLGFVLAVPKVPRYLRASIEIVTVTGMLTILLQYVFAHPV